MSTFAQTVTGDLDISTGNLVVRNDLQQVTAWKLSNMFGLAKGEWFLDLRVGLPYIQFILVHNPSLTLISTIFQRVIMSAPGVQAVTDMQLDFISATRSLTAAFQVATQNGFILKGGLTQPFIVDTRVP